MLSARPFTDRLRRMALWHYLWISLVLSEILTAGINSIASIIWRGKVSSDLLLIGSVDAFAVSLMVTAVSLSIISRLYKKGKAAGSSYVKSREESREITDARKEELERNYDTQRVINSILKIGLEENVSLDELLERSLNLVLSIPWLAFENRGAIFTVDDDPELLVLKTHKGLHESLLKKCTEVKFGKCLCGRAASEQEIQFSSRLDERHEVRCDGITLHGHYCVPIISEGKTLGLINMYLKEGHRRRAEEDEFLTTIANTLSLIIQRKQMEDAKEKMQAQLHHSQKLEAVGILVEEIAHDFNNILTSIRGNIELAMMKIGEMNTIDDELKEVHHTTSLATDLTRQLLLFSRKHSPEPRQVDINTRIRDLVNMLSRVLGKNITIITELEPSLWKVKAASVNFEQVVMNLIINARDAMPGGGTIRIETENICIDKDFCKRCPHARQGDFVCITIQDTGTGMEKETIQNIFEPFFSTKGTGKGTGLGLYVVKKIIEQHKGWINVQSERGKGTTFRIYLPAAK
jgi:signal transduction histidine kinase